MYIIYQHINRINGMRYIGKAKLQKKHRTPEQAMNYRLYGHLYAAKTSNKKTVYFHNAINDYGIENFDHYIIQTNILTKEEANEQEKFWIKYLDSKKPNGYNLTDGGDGGATRSGRKPTQVQHEQTIRLNKSRVGQPFSKETCDKMSKASKGKKKTKEHCQNMSKGRRRLLLGKTLLSFYIPGELWNN
jgi:group I intron endonuclease